MCHVTVVAKTAEEQAKQEEEADGDGEEEEEGEGEEEEGEEEGEGAEATNGHAEMGASGSAADEHQVNDSISQLT